MFTMLRLRGSLAQKDKRSCINFIACVAAAFGSLHAAAAAAPGLDNTPPNVVVIMADDLDVGSFNTMVDEGLLPNIVSRLIDQGIVLSNAFVTDSLCCPSRATFLTGQYAHNHGVFTNTAPYGGVLKFDDSSTLATWLQGVGYRTGFVGKYLNGYGDDVSVDDPRDDQEYVPPGWDDWQALVGHSAHRVYDYWINDNKMLVHYGSSESDYQTDVLAQRAADFIAEAETTDAQPFFLYVTPLAPHVETAGPRLLGCETTIWDKTIRPAPGHIGSLPPQLTLPKPISFNEADLSDKPWFAHDIPSMSQLAIDCVERQYLDMLGSLRAVDDLIGTIYDALAEWGELDSTVVVFTSDNGFFHGEHHLAGKILAYEEAIRVPLVVRPPAGTSPFVVDRFVINNDLAPTIAELAGATPGTVVDGRSIIPLLRDPSGPWRSRFLVSQLRPVPLYGIAGTKFMNIIPFSAVRTSPEDVDSPNRLFVAWQDKLESIEFYDMTNDPFQVESAHDNPSYETERQVLDALRASLLGCSGQTCQVLED